MTETRNKINSILLPIQSVMLNQTSTPDPYRFSALATGMTKHIPESLLSTPLKHYPEPLVRQVIETLPKIDLHRHLEGSISPESLIDLAKAHHISLPANTVETLRPYVQVTSEDTSLLDFLEKFKVIGSIFKSEQSIEAITCTCLREAAVDSLIYVELRFSPFYMARMHKLDPEAVIQAVLRGMKTVAEEKGIITSGIIIVERQESLAEAAACATLAQRFIGQGIVALDLANDEFNYPPAPFAPVFQAAKKDGLYITVHAGEAAGPENIKTAIELLHADRIGHGVRIVHDATILSLALEKNIPLELCYTSNLQTGAINQNEPYPLRTLLDQGLPITINTDDPAISGITLSDDYMKLIAVSDLTLGDIRRLLHNACQAAFVSDSVKASLFGKIESGVQNAAKRLTE